MKGKGVILVFMFIFCIYATAFAGPKSATGTTERSGSYQTAIGNSGTFKQTATHESNQASKSFTWTNQNGNTGSHSITKNLDTTTGTLNTTESLGLPGGKGLSSSRVITKNPAGGYTVQNSVTTGEGRTFTNKTTYQKTDNGISATGSYGFGNGRSGTYTATAGITDGHLVKTQSLTVSDGKTVQHTADTTYQNGTFTRKDSVTGADGKTGTLTTTATGQLTNNGLAINANFTTGKGLSAGLKSLRSIDNNGQLVTNQTLTGQNGNSIDRHSGITLQTVGFSQDVTYKGPQGNTKDFTRGVTIDNVEQVPAEPAVPAE